MINMMVDMVQQPAVLWTVLCLGVAAVIIESFRTSSGVLWGELAGDLSDDD